MSTIAPEQIPTDHQIEEPTGDFQLPAPVAPSETPAEGTLPTAEQIQTGRDESMAKATDEATQSSEAANWEQAPAPVVEQAKPEATQKHGNFLTRLLHR